MITVTPEAREKISEMCVENAMIGIRAFVHGGGCGGLIASWDTEPHYEPEQGEQTWPLANGKFVVDEGTADFIDGGTVNYDLTNFMPNFIVVVPGKGQCGCGSSFVVPK